MIDANDKVKIIDFGLDHKIEPCDFKSEDIAEWSIPSSPSPYTSFYEVFFRVEYYSEKTRVERRGSPCNGTGCIRKTSETI